VRAISPPKTTLAPDAIERAPKTAPNSAAARSGQEGLKARI
jgi:hypothetical protein